MTLIITELHSFGYERGIAMAADTALTIDSRTVAGVCEERAFFGWTKLLQVPKPKLMAGISYWGWTKMPPSSKSGVWMDWWLKHFLVNKIGDYNSVGELANLLEIELQKLVPSLTDEELEIGVGDNFGGIHLAGLVDWDGKKVPCFWHIHNGFSQALPNKPINPHIVNANYDCPPKKYLEEYEAKGKTYQTRNGDYEPYALYFDKYLSKYQDELSSKMGYKPLPTTDFAADFLRTQINFISGMYAVSGIVDRRVYKGTIKRLARGIGGNVTTLAITEQGIKYSEF